MVLSTCTQMDSSEKTRHCELQVGNVNLGKMHIDFMRSMCSRYVLPVHYW